MQLRVIRTTILIALGVLAAACVGPARSYAVYESRATHSADEAESAAQTVLAGIRDATRDDAFAPYVSVLMNDAERGASTALDAFSSIQPPDEPSDRLRAQLLPLLQRIENAVAAARIAARRGDTSALSGLQGTLTRLASRLSAFLERHEP
jgi:hypothetical protein